MVLYFKSLRDSLPFRPITAWEGLRLVTRSRALSAGFTFPITICSLAVLARWSQASAVTARAATRTAARATTRAAMRATNSGARLAWSALTGTAALRFQAAG